MGPPGHVVVASPGRPANRAAGYRLPASGCRVRRATFLTSTSGSGSATCGIGPRKFGFSVLQPDAVALLGQKGPEIATDPTNDTQQRPREQKGGAGPERSRTGARDQTESWGTGSETVREFRRRSGSHRLPAKTSDFSCIDGKIGVFVRFLGAFSGYRRDFV